MSAKITMPSGKVRIVKNLGWLIRHGGDIYTVKITETDARNASSGTLVAKMADGSTYETEIASVGVMTAWMYRPSMSGARLCVETRGWSFADVVSVPMPSWVKKSLSAYNERRRKVA